MSNQAKITHAQLMGEKGSNSFYYLIGPTGVVGISIMSKKEMKKLSAVEDNLEIIKKNMKVTLVTSRASYWSCWLFAAFSDLPIPSEGVVFVINSTNSAYGLNFGTMRYHDWWKFLVFKEVDGIKEWCFEGDEALYKLTLREPKVTASLMERFNAIISTLGADTKIMAKEDRRNGAVLIKTNSSHKLLKKK